MRKPSIRTAVLWCGLVMSLAARGGGEPAVAAAGGAIDYAPWARTLAGYHHEGGLDYAALAADRGDLDQFLEAIGDARPGEWSAAQQVAFWSNAYNAVVAHLVLVRYPGLDSVRSVDGFFDELRFPVAGAERTLDEIEDEALALGDPRVHFAVVCASVSCPDLRAEPYVGARLDEQLDEQAAAFLADASKGLRYDREANRLWLSSIFMWYAGDFTGGSTVVAFFARGQVVDWILPRLPRDLRAAIEARNPGVRYLDYDWGLNDRRRP